ncbi:MAG: calcium-binding protein [Pseudomonadota bacterium]
MNNTALTLCLSVAIMAGLATESFAAGDRFAGKGPSFEEVDANADGLMSPEELQAHREARFAETDINGDGALTRDEIEARMDAKGGERRAKFLDRMFERRDANANGQLSLEEMTSDRTAKMFERADADGDGLISKAEFEAARDARRQGKKSDK